MSNFLRPAVFGFLMILLAASWPGATAQAQEIRSYPEHQFGPRCAFDSVQDAAWRRNPAGRQQYQAFLRQAQAMSSNDQARLLAAPDVTVPVVMHIIYSNTTNNISDAQVNDAMRIINLDYSKKNADTSDIIPLFRPLIANVGFKFRLAQRDPSGNCTTGITRTYSTDTNIGDDRVKSLIVWDQARYLNVWICENANGAGGYSILPCQGGTSDGIVIRNAQFGSIGTSCGSNLCRRSLTHEIGHYFGLPHTWGGNNTPGLASNCSLDDGIADTPNTAGNTGGGCNTGAGICTTANGTRIIANTQNYMDYADCEKMFTLGQRAVMRASLTLSCRSTLVSASNLIATGTNDGYVPVPCAPVVAFRSTATSICETGSVTFTDASYNANLTAAGTVYSWLFAGGTPRTSNQRNPTITYNTGGLYDVTLTVTTTTGSATRTVPQMVQVIGANSGLRTPVSESFEAQTFPNNFPAPDLRNWTSTSSSTASLARWARLPATGGTVVPDGTACAVVRSTNLTNGTQVWLTSPNIDLSTFTVSNPPVLQFDRAYVRRPSGANEQLQVQVSTDCGVNWFVERTYNSAALNTLGAQLINGFIPDSLQQWQTLSLPIDDPSYLGPRFQLRFQLTTRQGNPFYLDHIRFGIPAATRSTDFATAGLRLYPNPYTPETVVEIPLTAPTLVQMSITDVLGRELLSQPAQRLSTGLHTLPLAANNLRAGLYVVRVSLDGRLHTTKLVIR